MSYGVDVSPLDAISKLVNSVNIEELLNHSGPFRDEKATRGNMSNKRQKALFLAFNTVQ